MPASQPVSLHHPSVHQRPAHYRADIDGLRAVAVLVVVAFHAFPQWMPGGFIGVDIFFVISGFLITNILLGDIEAKRFSFAGFYARRIRRIFPALLVVLLSAYAFGYWVLFPAEWLYLQMQLAAGASFVANFALWQSLGYFAPEMDALPLMHLWSLSIEEQFYIIWPVWIWLASRWRAGLPWCLGLVALLSFAANMQAVYDNTASAFYLPYCRFWEMAAGGLVAVWLARVQVPSGWSVCMAIAGVLMLLAGLVLIDKTRFFPGAWALLPVLSTCLLVAAGPGAIVNRLLARRWLVGIGLISYPLYLWHWPLLSFARILEETTPSATVRAFAVVLSVILAWATYRFIELPVRYSPHRRVMVAALSGAMLLMIMVSLATFWHARQVQEAHDAEQANVEFEPDWVGWQKCTTTWDCRILDRARPVQVMVIGDSHAGHLGSGLREVFAPLQQNVQMQQRSMCLPLFRLQLDGKPYFDCSVDFIDRALMAAINTPSVHTVILAGYANQFIYTWPEGVPVNANLRQSGETEAALPNPQHVRALRQGMQHTLARLAASGKQVVFMVDNPELDFEPRECVSLRKVTLPGRTVRSPCAVGRVVHETRSADYHLIVREMAQQFPSVQFVWLDEGLCDGQSCKAMHDGVLLYSDRSHLTPAGSIHVLQAVRDRLVQPVTP